MTVPESRAVVVRDALVHVTPSQTVHGGVLHHGGFVLHRASPEPSA